MRKVLIIIMTIVFVFSSTLSFAAEDKGAAMVGDTVLVRPLGIVATVVGAAVFVVSLPFSLLGGNVKEAGHDLVAAPATFTFKRPLGDFGPDGPDKY